MGHATDSRLADALHSVRQAAEPDLGARLVLPAAGMNQELAGLLARGDSPMLGEAICLAGSLRDPRLLAPLRHLADHGPTHLRAAALLAADRVEPWPEAELVSRLAAPVPELVVAAVHLASQRAVPPVAQMLSLLEHRDPAVRDAALAALPMPLSDRMVDSELARARELPVPPPQLMAALARGTNRPDVEEFLITFLDARDADTRLAALDALGDKRGVLMEGERVADLVCDAGRPVAERAMAVWCCERTATLGRLDTMLGGQGDDAVLDYSLGRCLLCALDPRAFPTLVHTLDAEASQVPKDVFHAAQHDARDLLGHQAGAAEELSERDLREWATGAQQVIPMPLSPSAIRLLLPRAGG
jgi:hypothetical protein